MENVVDVAPFEKALAEHGGELASKSSYPADGSTFGDPATAAEHAPTVVARMKQAGVATVDLFSDFSMTNAMTERATRQEWYPEWFFTGAVYQEIAVLGRRYRAEQAAHAFGISNLSPYVRPEPPPPLPQKSPSVLTNVQSWYWGEGAGTCRCRCRRTSSGSSEASTPRGRTFTPTPSGRASCRCQPPAAPRRAAPSG